ncbi:unnamed protein product [Discosporangium mesarthrocarpum]
MITLKFPESQQQEGRYIPVPSRITATDTAPAMELEFWDTLAAAYLRYYGQAIILKVNMAGLKKTQNKEENEKKTAPSLSPAVDEETGPASSPGQGSGLGTAENQGVRENVEAVEKFEMVPMKDVPYLGRSERLGIIQATVPTEKRRMVLQRLFCISQAPPEEFEAMIELAKVKGNEAGADVIRDVNLLESWQVVREERDHLWTAAKEKVRSIVEQQRQTETSAEEATPQETAQEETPTPTSGQGGKEGKGGAGSGGV